MVEPLDLRNCFCDLVDKKKPLGVYLEPRNEKRREGKKYRKEVGVKLQKKKQERIEIAVWNTGIQSTGIRVTQMDATHGPWI
jgi:hypothetical protein